MDITGSVHHHASHTLLSTQVETPKARLQLLVIPKPRHLTTETYIPTSPDTKRHHGHERLSDYCNFSYPHDTLHRQCDASEQVCVLLSSSRRHIYNLHSFKPCDTVNQAYMMIDYSIHSIPLTACPSVNFSTTHAYARHSVLRGSDITGISTRKAPVRGLTDCIRFSSSDRSLMIIYHDQRLPAPVNQRCEVVTTS